LSPGTWRFSCPLVEADRRFSNGSRTTASTVGAIIYPPLTGIVADQVGIRIGLLGAALLGLPAAAALRLATAASRDNHTVLSGITTGRAEP